MEAKDFLYYGKNVKIWPLARLVNRNEIWVGDNVMVDDFTLLNGRGGLMLGAYVHIGSFTSITGGGGCKIEAFTNLSSGVRIFSGTESYTGSSLMGPCVPQNYRNPFRKEVNIGEHVLIGANTVILPGATIETGVIIGAGSVVLENEIYKAWGIYVGAPAHWVANRPSRYCLELGEEVLRED